MPGPVGGQVQDRSALRLGESGGNGDQVSAEGGRAGFGVESAGQAAGGAEQVVADGGADGPGGVGVELNRPGFDGGSIV